MGARGNLRVAVIYSHPLLGEGIGRMLAAEPGLDVSQAPCDDGPRTAAAVAAAQDVIVLERNCDLGPTDILRDSPDTLVIEMSLHPGATWAYRRQEIPNRPEAILALIRRLRGGHPEVLSEGAEAPAEPSPPSAELAAAGPAAAEPHAGVAPSAALPRSPGGKRGVGELVHGS
jgi:hypothetical protein